LKTLTEIAVRLRVISTSLLSILGFICLGLVIGWWLGSRNFAGPRIVGTADPPSTQKWCDATHRVPYIPASQCGGGSSCDRAFFMMGKYPPDWNAFCANIDSGVK
jgi:hypothetical protein